MIAKLISTVIISDLKLKVKRRMQMKKATKKEVKKEPSMGRKISQKFFVPSKEYKENRKKLFSAVENLSIGDRMLFYELFEIFETHVGICKQLIKEIKGDGVIIEKEYVKGRPTIVAHPAITNYNASTKAMNTTASQLSKLFDKLGESDKAGIDLKEILGKGSE